MNLRLLAEPLGQNDRMIRYFKLPSKDKCLIHRKTTILGKPILNSEKCGCCGYRYEKQILDPMFYPQDVYYLGSGLVLYFAFIKVAVTLAIIGCLVFTGTNLYFNYTSNACATTTITQCSSTIFIQLSIANKLNNKTAMQIQAYLSIATVIFSFLALQIFRTYQKNIQIDAQAHLNPSHYSILIRMPNKQYQQTDIRQIIQYWWQLQHNRGIKARSHQFPIQKVIISYELQYFNILIQQKRKLQKSLHNQKLTQQQTFQKQQRVRQISAEIANMKFQKTTKAIVIFSYIWQMQYIVSRHQKTVTRVLFPSCYNFVKYMDKRVQISRAAMPAEIHWENHFRLYKHKFWFRVLIGISCMVLIIAGQAGIFGLLYYWFYYKSSFDNTSQQYASYVVSALVVIVNIILQKYRPTTLEQFVSITIKKVIAIFLNSGILLLFVYLILSRSSIWIANGFVDTITLSFIYCLFVPHILKYIDYQVIMSIIRRLRMNSNPQQIPQAEANKAYERIDSLMYDKYGWMVSLLWWAGLFAPLIPVTFPCVAISIFIHYWLEKYNFVTIYRQPKPFGSHMNTEMFKVLTMSPFFLAAGNLGMNVIILFINNEQPTLSVLLFDIISIGISLLGFVLPAQTLDKMVRCCIKKQYQIQEIVPYKQQQDEFITTYQKQNPIYNYISHHIEHQKQRRSQQSPMRYKKDLSIKVDKIQGVSNGSERLSPLGQQYPRKVFNKVSNKKTEIYVPPLQTSFVTYNPTQKKKAQQRIAYVSNIIAEFHNDQEE